MEVIHLTEENSVLNTFIAELRDVKIQRDAMRFRRNLERIGQIMAYEISKQLDYTPREIQTPLATIAQQYYGPDVVLASVFRAGLPLHNGFLDYFDKAENAFVGAFRQYTDSDHEEFDIIGNYVATPDLNGKVLIFVDTMLATGCSIETTLNLLLKYGTPRQIHFATVIASQAGVDRICAMHLPVDKATLWCGAIDPYLNEHAYIVPGLGDAGDLAYGGKL